MKKVTALLLALAFIPTFSLRGGIWHNTFNFSYLFAAVAFCTMLLFILRYLFINRSSKVKIALVTNADQPLLSGVELSILLWVIFTTALMGLSYFYSPAPAVQWVIKIDVYKRQALSAIHTELYQILIDGLEMITLNERGQ